MEFKDKKLYIRPLVLAQLPSCGSSDLTYQALSSSGRFNNADVQSQISLSELNAGKDMMGDGRTKRNQVDRTFVDKMCKAICCCFTCFDRPEENGHEYNNVPIAIESSSPPTAQSKKRTSK